MNKKEHLKKALEDIRKNDFPEIPNQLVDEIIRIQSSVDNFAKKQQSMAKIIIEYYNKQQDYA